MSNKYVYEAKVQVKDGPITLGTFSSQDDAIHVCFHTLRKLYPGIEFERINGYIHPEGLASTGRRWFGCAESVPLDDFYSVLSRIDGALIFGPNEELLRFEGVTIAREE